MNSSTVGLNKNLYWLAFTKPENHIGAVTIDQYELRVHPVNNEQIGIRKGLGGTANNMEQTQKNIIFFHMFYMYLNRIKIRQLIRGSSLQFKNR